MNRSNRYIIVPCCVLAQGIRAQGIARNFAAIINPLVDLLQKHNINIFQMPCPELYFDGFQRKPCGKSKYDNERNRSICAKIAQQQIELIQMLLNNGKEVIAILGIDFSPSCAVNFLTGRPPVRRVSGQGIFVEEIQKVLKSNKMEIKFIGIETYHIDVTLKELEKVIGV